MAVVRFETRNFSRKPIPELCFEVGQETNVDYSRVAEQMLAVMTQDMASIPARSCHFFVEDREVGAAYIDRKTLDA
jgi:hypothetical protein